VDGGQEEIKNAAGSLQARAAEGTRKGVGLGGKWSVGFVRERYSLQLIADAVAVGLSQQSKTLVKTNVNTHV
jgi:hypothetical protein